MFPGAGLSTKKQNMGEIILQIQPPLCPTSHYEVTNTDRKPHRVTHQVNS